jgi:superfamily I DNA and RNA helicase
MFSALQNSLEGLRGRSVTIQTYSWKSRRENKAEDLKFDVPDVVTVLNVQSCKGLEFDAVFIVDMHQAQIGIYGPDRFKMQMFVAVSRGRDWVSLIDSGPRAGIGPHMECLPSKEFLDHEDQSAGRKSKTASSSVNVKPERPRNIEHDKAKTSSTLDQGEDWEAALAKLKTKLGLMTRDMRPVGGALWVDGGRQLRAVLEPLGFDYSEKREGWWRK